MPEVWTEGQWYIYEKFSIFHPVGLLCSSMYAWKRISKHIFVRIDNKRVRDWRKTECRISNQEGDMHSFRTAKLQYLKLKVLLLQKRWNKIVSCLNLHSINEKALPFGIPDSFWNLSLSDMCHVDRFGYLIVKYQLKFWKWPVFKD